MTSQAIVIFSMQNVQAHAAALLPMSAVNTGTILIRLALFYTITLYIENKELSIYVLIRFTLYCNIYIQCREKERTMDVLLT